MNSYPQGSNQQKPEDNNGLFTALAGIGLAGLGIIGGKRLASRYRTEPVTVKVDPGATAGVRRASTADIPKIPAEVKRQQDVQAFYQEARQPSGRGVVVKDLNQQDPGVLERATRDVTQAANKEAADQFLARGQEPAGVLGGLVKPSQSPSDLLSQTIQEVSVRELGSPQPQVPGGSLGQGILTAYPTFSQRKAAYDAAAAKPKSELKPVYRPKGEEKVELLTDPVTGEMFAPGQSRPGVTPRNYIEAEGFVPIDEFVPVNTMVDQQDARLGLQVDQSVAAINSAEDQATGRVMHRLQANEDLDIGAVNAAKEQVEAQLAETVAQNPEIAGAVKLDAAANEVASNLSDGLPLDQAEGVTRSINAQEQLALAKEEMIARRQSLEASGLRPGTTRFERALAQPFRTSEYTQMRGTGEIETALPAGPIRETVESVSASEYLPERSVLNIGPQAQVTSTAAGTSIRGASPSYENVPSNEERRQLFGTADPLVKGAPDELGQDLPGSARARGIAPQLEEGEGLSKQEIVYSALDRPATPEVQGGSAGVGVYGLEPGYVPGAMSKATGEYSEAASRKPSYVPAWLQKRQATSGFEALSTGQLKSGAEKATGSIKKAFESELGRRTASKEAIAFSEIARRAIIEGRDIPSAFKEYGVDISPVQGPREAVARTTKGTRPAAGAEEPKLRIASPEDWYKQQDRRRGLI